MYEILDESHDDKYFSNNLVFQLVLEGVKEKQIQDALRMEAQNICREIEQASILQDFYKIKLVRLEDQVKDPSLFTWNQIIVLF